MGALVLGILVGWLLEWLFFTYWIKGRSTGKFADCSGLKSQLSTKNNEISALKAELNKTKANISVADKSSPKEIAPTTKSTSTEKPAASTKSSPSEAKKTSSEPKKNATKKKTANVKPKPVAKKATSKKSKTTSGDNLTKLSGIGPSMAAKLNGLGISTFQKLSEMDDDILRDMLEEAGAKLNNNKEAMDSWNEQAALAAKGDFAELKKLQEKLKA